MNDTGLIIILFVLGALVALPALVCIPTAYREIRQKVCTARAWEREQRRS